MKRFTFICLFSFSLLILTSGKSKNSVAVEGSYGVCACEGNSSSKVTLTLKDDQTYQYVNKSDPNRPLDLEGTWIRKGSSIHLESKENTISFHDDWKVDGETNCLKSRNKLEFMRLCHLKHCSN